MNKYLFIVIGLSIVGLAAYVYYSNQIIKQQFSRIYYVLDQIQDRLSMNPNHSSNELPTPSNHLPMNTGNNSINHNEVEYCDSINEHSERIVNSIDNTINQDSDNMIETEEDIQRDIEKIQNEIDNIEQLMVDSDVNIDDYLTDDYSDISELETSSNHIIPIDISNIIPADISNMFMQHIAELEKVDNIENTNKDIVEIIDENINCAESEDSSIELIEETNSNTFERILKDIENRHKDGTIKSELDELDDIELLNNTELDNYINNEINKEISSDIIQTINNENLSDNTDENIEKKVDEVSQQEQNGKKDVQIEMIALDSKLNDLKEYCKSANISQKGTKTELIKRLIKNNVKEFIDKYSNILKIQPDN